MVVALVTQGVFTALMVLLVVLAVQQIEGHVLQPFILGRAVRVHPLAVVLAVAAGGMIAGIGGAVVAVPLVAVTNTVVGYLRAYAREQALRAPPRRPARTVGRRRRPTPWPSPTGAPGEEQRVISEPELVGDEEPFERAGEVPGQRADDAGDRESARGDRPAADERVGARRAWLWALGGAVVASAVWAGGAVRPRRAGARTWAPTGRAGTSVWTRR